MYYSQFGEDKFIDENNLLPDIGFFVDVGAGDPVKLSNTYFFEQKGWDGICIDPDPRQLVNLRAKRKNVIQGAVCAADGKVNMDFHSHPDLSRIDPKGNETVHCFSLETILNIRDIDRVDLLSIDVEGQELEVMKGFDPLKYGVKIIIIEHATTGIGSRGEEIDAYFRQLPYKLVHATAANFIYQLTTTL